MNRTEGEGQITPGVIEPESARPDEIRILHGQAQMTVVVLGPFLRRGEGPVEGAEALLVGKTVKESR